MSARLDDTVPSPEGLNGEARELADWRHQHLGMLLYRTLGTYEADVMEGYRAHGMKPRKTYLPALRNLDLEGNRITDLASRAGLSKQAMGRIVAELEALGIVRTDPDPSDGRAKIVRFTPAGIHGLRAGRAIIEETERRYAAGLEPGELDRLRDLLIAFLVAFEPRLDESRVARSST